MVSAEKSYEDQPRPCISGSQPKQWKQKWKGQEQGRHYTGATMP